MELGDERIKKRAGEYYFYKGQRVWLMDDFTVSLKGEGKCLGEVAKDSIWPDMFVTVNLWDKDKAADYWNRNLPQWVKDQNRRKAVAHRNRKRIARGPRI